MTIVFSVFSAAFFWLAFQTGFRTHSLIPSFIANNWKQYRNKLDLKSQALSSLIFFHHLSSSCILQFRFQISINIYFHLVLFFCLFFFSQFFYKKRIKSIRFFFQKKAELCLFVVRISCQMPEKSRRQTWLENCLLLLQFISIS